MVKTDAGINVQPELSDQEQRLKYLFFVHAAATRAVELASTVYNLAKEKSGPLRPGIQTVEGTVKTVIGPVYIKFHDVPLDLLKFADYKVEDLVDKVKRHLPPKVIEASQKMPEVARSITSEVYRSGVVGAATGVAKTAYSKLEPTAKELYGKYEPVAEQYAVKTWRSLNRLPLVPEVAHVVVPTVAFCLEKYNNAVMCSAERGYAVSTYLPLVPTEKIADIFGGEVKRGVKMVEISEQK